MCDLGVSELDLHFSDVKLDLDSILMRLVAYLYTDPRPPGPAPALLDWPTVHKEMQWGVILLLGGGFAIADACKVESLLF